MSVSALQSTRGDRLLVRTLQEMTMRTFWTTLPTLIIIYVKIWFGNLFQNYVCSKITCDLGFKLNISTTTLGNLADC